MPKANLLKNMKISEISLVTEPASPGAVVLFTKGHGQVGDARIRKFNPDEPRDERGRWTRTAVAAIGHAREATRQAAQRLSDHAKKMANMVAEHHLVRTAGDRLSSGVGVGLSHTASAIRTTRARGAHPVRGGGVQFDFEHTLADASKLLTSVQLRPEHLPSEDRVERNERTGKLELRQSGIARRGLQTLHNILVTSGRQPVDSFSGRKPQDWLTVARQSPEDVAAATHAQAVREAETDVKRRAELSRARGLFSSSTPSSSTSSYSQPGSRPAPAPMSTELGGNKRNGPGGVPEFVPSEAPPAWVREAYQQRPQGYGQKDPEGFAIPLSGNHTARTAGGQSYYHNDQFIPSGPPHVQEFIQEVHGQLKNSAEMRAIRDKQVAENIMPSRAGGRAHFSPEGWYIPFGSQEQQLRFRSRYQNEADRIEEANARATAATKSHAPQQLFKDPLAESNDAIDEYLARDHRHSRAGDG